MGFRRDLEKMWEAEPGKVVPHILFVEEWYKRPVYWDLRTELGGGLAELH